jgi:single-stranded-DNA-specific exonuclease
MGSAISRLQRTLANGETIGIFSDFDADGITGTALLADGLESLGDRVVAYLPHRVTEGHTASVPWPSTPSSNWESPSSSP